MSTIRTSKLRRYRMGAAAVEFAVLAPVLFLSVFGLIEMSRMMMIQQAFTNAAREGSRKAALVTTQDAASVESHVRNFLKGVIPNAVDTNLVEIVVTPDTISDLTSGSTVTVDVGMSFADVSWVPGSYLGGDGFDIVGHASKQRE